MGLTFRDFKIRFKNHIYSSPNPPCTVCTSRHHIRVKITTARMSVVKEKEMTELNGGRYAKTSKRTVHVCHIQVSTERLVLYCVSYTLHSLVGADRSQPRQSQSTKSILFCTVHKYSRIHGQKQYPSSTVSKMDQKGSNRPNLMYLMYGVSLLYIPKYITYTYNFVFRKRERARERDMVKTSIVLDPNTRQYVSRKKVKKQSRLSARHHGSHKDLRANAQ